jgi:hypothetical protein
MTYDLLSKIKEALDPGTRISVVHDDLILNVAFVEGEVPGMTEDRATTETGKVNSIINNHFKCKQHE